MTAFFVYMEKKCGIMCINWTVSMNHNIVDRRNKPSGANSTNRQKFLKRVKKHVKKSVEENFKDRGIESKEGHTVSVPTKGISEPTFSNDSSTGSTDTVVVGNDGYINGDIIEKPQNGSGGGRGEASDSGEGEDQFIFELTEEEYNEIIFEGLELPDVIKVGGEDKSFKTVKSGHKSEGNPSQIDMARTMKKSIARRLCFGDEEAVLIKLRKQLSETTGEHGRKRIEMQIEMVEEKGLEVPYIIEKDARYKDYKKIHYPAYQALMVCVMDVSGSMGQREKDLAKRFFILLHKFLVSKYDSVDIVFIRHHTTAKECDEQEFFFSKESGGTIASTAFSLANQIIDERYPLNEWNIYVTQVSDGDNFSSDNLRLREEIESKLLPKVQHFYYLEAQRTYEYDTPYLATRTQSDIWEMYKEMEGNNDNFTMKEATEPEDVYSVFREMFSESQT